MSIRYFVDVDDAGPELWAEIDGNTARPTYVLTPADLGERVRDDAWPKIVAALTEQTDPAALVETANILADPETMAAVAEARSESA